MELGKDLRSRQEVRELVDAADKAQSCLCRMDQQAIDKMVAAMAKAAEKHADQLARLAAEETGFGNAGDKTQKNLFAARNLWNAIKDQKTRGILRKDTEKQVWDVAVPVGVIAGIVPSTNPTSTVIYKAMIAVKAGNAIVFSPHPGARNCTLQTVHLLEKALVEAGGPKGALGCITTPTMDAVDELMHHPQVKLILATGGAAMVRSAYSSGKPAIGVGAGNGPAYLHHSCDLPQAVADIIKYKTFDNGVICASEQSVIVEKARAKEAAQEFIRQGCVLLSETDSKKLAAFLFRENGTMNPRIVGKTAGEIARLAGLSCADARVLLARETGAGRQHPYSMEKLCPILAWYEVEDETEALRLACAILSHEGSGHTFSIHARDQAVVERFALEVPVSRFLVNTPAALGGVGVTTGLFPALTLGCGAVGGSSSSNNIGPMDLIDIRRIAWGNSREETVHTTVDEALLDALTQKLYQKLMRK